MKVVVVVVMTMIEEFDHNARCGYALGRSQMPKMYMYRGL